jgi:hypothetical protein
MNDAPIEDWWTPAQLECAIDTSRNWRYSTFQANDIVLERADTGWIGHKRDSDDETPPDGKIFKDGWDHEHCFLCWSTISGCLEDSNVGYTDENDWVCVDCFEKYVAPRRLPNTDSAQP